MARVRGSLFANSVLYVGETYGPGAHERVLEALAPEHRRELGKHGREAQWVGYEAVVEYMEAAHRLLDPGDGDFFRKLGRFSGTRQRVAGGFAPMVKDPPTAARMAIKLWHALHDTGELRLLHADASRVLVRIVRFPARLAYCERRCGALEGMLGTDERPARVRELTCAAAGSPHCDIEVVWSGTA